MPPILLPLPPPDSLNFRLEIQVGQVGVATARSVVSVGARACAGVRVLGLAASGPFPRQKATAPAFSAAVFIRAGMGDFKYGAFQRPIAFAIGHDSICYQDGAISNQKNSKCY